MANIHRMTKKRLGELLLQEEVINDEQLRQGLEEQKKTGELIGEILVRKSFCNESDIARTISTQFSFPYISVLHYYIAPEMTELFSLQMIEKHLFVPIDKFGDVLNVVVAGLLDQDVVNEIEKKSGCTCQVYVGMVSEVKQVIKEKFAAQAARTAGASAAKRAAGHAPVDVTAPPKRKPAAAAAEKKADEETIDLSQEIMAAETTARASEDDDEDVVEKAEQDLKRFRFFESDEEDKNKSS
jgi:pyruvate/2-oxoglutarate dehydrogenase complex dihydrolipoamide acyltransferase (E2) component